WSAAVVDVALFVHRLHAGHDLIHLPGEAIERLLRRERAGIDVADVLPEQLGELRIVGHVDAGRRPRDAVGRAVELDEATELRRAFRERLVANGAVADERQADVALLHVYRLGDDELSVEPGRLAAVNRRGIEKRPRTGVLVSALRTFLPVRTVRRRRHPPERHAVVVDRVVASTLRRNHVGSEGRVPEDLLGDIALGERRQRLVEVEVGGARGRIFAEPLVPLRDRIDRCRAVGAAAARHRSADRVAGTLLHADAPFVDGATVGYSDIRLAGHRQPRIGHAPAEVRGALAVVHVAVNADAVDLLHVVGEE